VPLETEELKKYVLSAPIANGQIRETPELRAVRECLSIAQINGSFVAAEESWLNAIRLAVYRALREIWSDASNLDHAEAQADWLLSVMPDPLAWCPHPENETVWAATKQQLVTQIGLLMFFINGTLQRRQRYFSWLEARVLSIVRKERPEVWDTVIEFFKAYLIHLLEGDDET
jgi:hypothetical protein